MPPTLSKSELLIQSTETGFESGLPKETQFTKEVKLHNSLEEVKKRLSKAPEDQKQRGEEVLQKGEELMQRLRKNARNQGRN